MVFNNRHSEKAKKMSPEELDKLLEEMGGKEVVMQGFEQYRKDREFLEKNFLEWRKLYPDHWIAVFKEELIVVEKDIFELLEIIKNKNIPCQFTVPIAFLDTKPSKPLILNCQK